jgi:hypothetical protein
MKTARLALIFALALFTAVPPAEALFGIGEPPITLTIRESKVGAGMVLMITNTSDEPLHQITVSASNDDAKRELKEVVVATTLKPHATIEVGWMELDWAFQPGELVRVGAKGYMAYVRGTVPE